MDDHNQSNKLRGEYAPGQDPQERLKNLLGSYFSLVNILADCPQVISSDNSELAEKLRGIVSRDIVISKENQELIRDYLHDIPIFYQQQKDT